MISNACVVFVAHRTWI